MKQELSEEVLVEQLKQLNYPHQVDVVDNVMEQVSRRPLLSSKQRRLNVWHIAIGVAACFAACFVVNMTLMLMKTYDEPSISNMLAEVYYNDYTIESLALEDESITIEDYLYSEDY